MKKKNAPRNGEKLTQNVDNLWKSLWIIAFLLITSPFLGAQNQDLALADDYFDRQEYEKAREMYEKLARNPRYSTLIYRNYLQTLVQLKDYREAEKWVKRQIKDNSQNPTYRVDYAGLLETQTQIEKADAECAKIVEDFKKSPRETVLEATEQFLRLDKVDWAEKMLLAARKTAKDDNAYALELADVLRLLNKPEAMVQEYLNYAKQSPNHIEPVKGYLQDRLSKQEDFDKLERTLLEQLQKEPNEVTYNELLLWLYLQQKRFARAFVQAKALDKRYRLEGSELMNIGEISFKNADFGAAKSIFEYVINTYPNGMNYPMARNKYLKAKEEVIKNTFPIQMTEINSLLQDYKKLLNDLGKNYKTKDALRNMALLYAFYLDKKDTAISLLAETVEINKSDVNYVAQCKTDLGDIYLLKGEIWESTLLYSQVEKLKKDHPLGHEAKLKNAKLSFYNGEFSLAEEHLNILKEATSREIANDAMDLSLLIQDNLVFDTTGAALQEYAKIELMIFQHKDADALKALNKMQTDFAGNSIIDEVMWEKAKLLLKMDKPTEAIEILQKMVNEYGEDILGDDAYFLLAKTYEEKLKDKEKAKELYASLLDKYPGSIYIAEARKRFRILRGDFVN
jgi:tetratricopeptide (TPR) repeat protein